jgi:hypothetical protein
VKRVFFILLLLGMLWPPRGGADPTASLGPVSVRASVDHPEGTIGDPIRYTVEISAAADVELRVPVLSGAVGDFTITDFGDVPTHKENGRSIVTRWYTLTCFKTGEHVIPAPKVQYRLAGDELKDAEGNEVKVVITSLLAGAKNATEIRDIKPPEEVPFDWRPYGLGAALLVLLGLLGALFYYVLNRPRKRYVAPPIPPHEIALAALNKLRARHYTEEGRFADYYVELSAIGRRYLEDRFHLRAPEMTTEEFLAAAGRDPRLTPTQRRLLSEFLSQADLVKFARHMPTLDDAEAAFQAAKRFVDETRPDAGRPSAEVQHAAA